VTFADITKGKEIDDQVDAALDRLLVEFGKEILKIVPGKVSTEVDARFSFSTGDCVEKALHIIDVRLPFYLYNRASLIQTSYTNKSASAKSACSSRSPRHGKASKPPKSSNPNTA
jgi:hypothetical protein